MFVKSSIAMSAILLLVGILSSLTVAQSIGVCYGVIGGNLPSRQEVVDLYKTNGIGKMRIYYPDEEALQALKGSNIELIMDVAKETLQSLTDPKAATDWVNKYVTPYSQDVKFKYIAVGNEIHPNDNEAQYILSAMTNIQNAISSANLQGQIKVSTAIDSTLITNSYPPNNGVFTDNASPYIKPIISFLVNNGAPLLANVYPYFAYANDQQSITLAYALFTQQGNNDAGYQNLFDAMLDSIYAALEKVGASNLQIIVSESGWPSEGGDGATTENAATYYANLISHAKGGSGTPKRPGGPIETFLFAMFDENQKQGAETERHFGLFNPDKSPKYQLSFN
ncbi:Glucan endo-1,3-beta-glucosidase [Spatholobus suberectus]|nr:Glucan endo-1,3-beta-glucosidase [Spatholobus suberectus]